MIDTSRVDKLIAVKTFVYILTIGCIVFLAWAGTSYTHTLYYCQKCGMKATRDKYVWFGIPVRNEFSPSDTQYSRIYKQVIRSTCDHQWKLINSYTSGNSLHGAENADGGLPYALRFDFYYPRLKALHNSTRIAMVIRSLPLDDSNANFEHQRKIVEALDELNGKSQTQANKWWDKYKHLFALQSKSAATR